MREISVGAADRFPPGQFVMVAVPGRVGPGIGVVRLRDGSLRAVRNWCPHKGAPICRGIVGGTWLPSEPGALEYGRDGEVLVCPWHGFEYDLRTGEELYQPAPTRLRLYPVTVRDGQVYVSVRQGETA